MASTSAAPAATSDAADPKDFDGETELAGFVRYTPKPFRVNVRDVFSLISPTLVGFTGDKLPANSYITACTPSIAAPHMFVQIQTLLKGLHKISTDGRFVEFTDSIEIFCTAIKIGMSGEPATIDADAIVSILSSIYRDDDGHLVISEEPDFLPASKKTLPSPIKGRFYYMNKARIDDPSFLAFVQSAAPAKGTAAEMEEANQERLDAVLHTNFAHEKGARIALDMLYRTYLGPQNSVPRGTWPLDVFRTALLARGYVIKVFGSSKISYVMDLRLAAPAPVRVMLDDITREMAVLVEQEEARDTIVLDAPPSPAPADPAPRWIEVGEALLSQHLSSPFYALTCSRCGSVHHGVRRADIVKKPFAEFVLNPKRFSMYYYCGFCDGAYAHRVDAETSEANQRRFHDLVGKRKRNGTPPTHTIPHI